MEQSSCAKSEGWCGWFALALILGMASGGWSQSLPEGKGKEVVEAACTVCHGTSSFTGSRFSKSDWEYVVNDMIDRGALIIAEEVPIIVDYLTEHFGPEEKKPEGESATGKGNENKTGAEEPVAALGPGGAKIEAKTEQTKF